MRKFIFAVLIVWAIVSFTQRMIRIRKLNEEPPKTPGQFFSKEMTRSTMSEDQRLDYSTNIPMGGSVSLSVAEFEGVGKIYEIVTEIDPNSGTSKTFLRKKE